ncbi:uncharacterized protein AC631_01098 [Debaryomyces fabryi]|uniref:DAGKc domain-containing protein n=1 Tax=Debaryomyces fabryi TaxID=58627 RepID=A0A0V1Q3V1_9ASCO|nr:uncharacterized protein AC631_01098 [Debaryomyces fabryi]KSA03201.1 hypothetical protein AC631_01098 [Debaryomyces fabryi]CUM48480.1 unnamed protein product [Debaryomyces fabryi]
MSTERLIYSPRHLTEVTLEEGGLRITDQSLEVLHGNDHNHNFLSTCLQTYSKSGNLESHIPFKNIIWCEKATSDDYQDLYELAYMYHSSQSLKPETIQIQIKSIDPSQVHLTSENSDLSKYILSRAYKNSLISPSILVIINPHGGQGNAVRIYEQKILPILKEAHVNITYKETKYQGHGMEIAKTLDINSYDIIACCSGDGIPHEVINGFYQRPDKGLEAFNKIAVTQLPCGSGNALTLSTHGSNDASIATLNMLKSQRGKLDLMAVTQGSGDKEKTSLSFLTQCYGIIADSDIGTEHLRWMGPIRFDLGVTYKVFKRSKYPCDIYVNSVTESKRDVSDHFDQHYKTNTGLKTLTAEEFELKYPGLDKSPPDDWIRLPDATSANLNILYVGKMPYVSDDAQFFPAALPNDGSMDMIITDTNMSIIETTSTLLSVSKGTHVYSDKVHHSKILSYRLVPKLTKPENHYISIDGENFPTEALQVEIMPGILTGLLNDGNFVDTSFSK